MFELFKIVLEFVLAVVVFFGGMFFAIKYPGIAGRIVSAVEALFSKSA
jgi:uncharacterized membrane protein